MKRNGLRSDELAFIRSRGKNENLDIGDSRPLHRGVNGWEREHGEQRYIYN